MDNLGYVYKAGTNQLTQIKQSATTPTSGAAGLANQAANNYIYDEIGNLITDRSEGIDTIRWTVYGKVQKVVKSNGQTVEYRYDGTGNRVMKITGTKTTYYVRDASGNVMGIYEKENTQAQTTLIEQPIYGNARIGTYIGRTKKLHRTLGNKLYEISNHLGNVLATITDNKIYQTNGSLAKVISAQDYFAFGAAMPSRSYQDIGYSKYRYGFNGKEKDNEVADEVFDFGERLQSSKVCRFFSPDRFEAKFPHQSTYVFAGNSPISAVDVNGDSIYIVIDAKNVFKIGDKEAAKYSQMIGRDLLLRTVDGKKLLDKYENATRQDIYITIQEFKEPRHENTLAFTLDRNATFLMHTNGKIDIKKEIKYDVSLNDAMNFDGVKLKNPLVDFSIIAIDKKHLESNEYDKYDKAGTLYHEIKAHIDLMPIATKIRLSLKLPDVRQAEVEHKAYGETVFGQNLRQYAKRIAKQLSELKSHDKLAESIKRENQVRQ